MIDRKDLNEKSESLKTLLKAKHGARGRSLEARVKHAGRRLPKRIQREAQVITQAEAMPPHPKLALTVDSGRVSKAYDAIEEHLNGVDPKDRRKGKLLGWLGGQVFNLILIAAALITVLIWRGYVG